MGLFNKAKNASQKTGGEAKEKLGEKTGDKDLQTEGKLDKIAGSIKQVGENIKGRHLMTAASTPGPRSPAQELPAATAAVDAERFDSGGEVADEIGGDPVVVTGVRRTRSGTVWVSFIVGAIFLIALIDFVAQNGDRVSVHFLAFSGRTSQAVALLIAAVAAVLVVAIPASIRILQLRRQVKHPDR
jgi:uncharacterized integral membrane protein/uncharacterized protein YjbJ (UPF0337 family)